MTRSVEEVFLNDRTCYNYSPQPVTDKLLEEIYDLMKLGPTASNSCPLRVLFIKSVTEKDKLLQCLMPGNIEKTRQAPITALFAYDLKFYDNMSYLWPHSPEMKNYFKNNKTIAQESAFRNATLQAAYFMMIARGKNLDCGPMSGFYPDKINQLFFYETNLTINFICNLGYKAAINPRPRLPRLAFSEGCMIT